MTAKPGKDCLSFPELKIAQADSSDVTQSIWEFLLTNVSKGILQVSAHIKFS
jgi:hypothetical protein